MLNKNQILQLGYEINPDPDQPGKFYWKNGNEVSDMSFDSERLAMLAAADHAAHGMIEPSPEWETVMSYFSLDQSFSWTEEHICDYTRRYLDCIQARNREVLRSIFFPEEMFFKASLFDLLNVAEIIVIDDYEIEQVNDCGADASGNPVIRCECDEDNEWYFTDQEVRVWSADGGCVATTATTDRSEPCDVSFTFIMRRPIALSDITESARANNEPSVRAGC